MSEQTARLERDKALERLRSAPWLQREGVRAVFALLGGADQVRAVGGAVRDSLLGLAELDLAELDLAAGELEIDFATTHTPQQVMARAQQAGIRALPTGLDHGTVTLVLADAAYEVTTLRQDVKTDGRHARVAFGTDWRGDALRRDFTLNALYCGPDGTLFDPLDGLADCLFGRVRFIGDADRRIAEDRLRVFRFFRFSARLGGERFDREGLDAVRRAAGELGALSAERVGREMMSMLSLPRVAVTLEKMVDCGVLALDAEALAGLARYEALANPPVVEARLVVFARQWGIDQLKKGWRLSNAVIGAVSALDECVSQLGQIPHEPGADNRAAFECAGQLAVGVPLAAGLNSWSGEEMERIRARLAAITVPPFPLGGADLLDLGFEAGPELGRALAALQDAWIGSGFLLDRSQLRDLARQNLLKPRPGA